MALGHPGLHRMLHARPDHDVPDNFDPIRDQYFIHLAHVKELWSTRTEDNQEQFYIRMSDDRVRQVHKEDFKSMIHRMKS